MHRIFVRTKVNHTLLFAHSQSLSASDFVAGTRVLSSLPTASGNDASMKSQTSMVMSSASKVGTAGTSGSPFRASRLSPSNSIYHQSVYCSPSRVGTFSHLLIEVRHFPSACLEVFSGLPSAQPTFVFDRFEPSSFYTRF